MANSAPPLSLRLRTKALCGGRTQSPTPLVAALLSSRHVPGRAVGDLGAGIRLRRRQHLRQPPDAYALDLA